MGVTLYFSNQLMPLAEKLEENLAQADSAISPLDPPVVIVPNMNLSKWIKLTLARRSGIFMNVDFQYLETGLWQMLRSLSNPAEPEPELLDRERLTLLLFCILMAPDQEATDLAVINRYLDSREGREGDREIRCWQLAEELARLFQEYEYHRSDMIQQWLENRPVSDAMERCQKRIYLDMVALKNQLVHAGGRPMVSMGEYARSVLGATSADPNRALAVERIHFFGLSQTSPFHLQLLARLESRFDIRIYSLNPSREYWEDIKTPSEKKWIRRKTFSRMAIEEGEMLAGELFSRTDHPLLSAWGKPGRESIRLLCQLTDYDFQAGFTRPPRPDSVLAALGHGLLTLDTEDGPPAALAQDRSLQIAACPGIRREVETVYDSILYNLEADPSLCMTDIAVMVSDMARYKPVVDSVFSRQPDRIAYNLVDSVARTESVFARAVVAIMELARGNFSRKQVFDLLRNPCVMQKWRYDTDALALWIRWADALGIFHGYENPAQREEGDPVAGRFSWRQGLERLRLSRIMTPPADADGLGQPHFNGLVPFADLDTTDDALVEKFCLLIEALARALEPFNIPNALARHWRSAFFRVLDGFVEISTDMRGEEAVYRSLVQAFDLFVRYDDLAAVRESRELTAEALWAFVGTHLNGISGGRGDYLTGGVTVAALMPMRPIPFKVVYVLGLEEGRFPGNEPENRLDLRTRKRRIGDITPVERNRYLFLEILISVGRKLYLSYVSRDLQKDRDLEPCSVVHQLRRYVEQRIIGGETFKIRQIPIRPDSPDYIALDAVNDWSDVMVNSCPVDRLSCYRRSGLWTAFEDRASPDERGVADRYHPDFNRLERPPENESPPMVPLTTGLLRSYLLDPVDAVLRYHLGIGDPVDPAAEWAEMEDEPLASQFPLDYTIRTLPLHHWLSTGVSADRFVHPKRCLAEQFDALYADLSRKSRVPANAFGAHDRGRLKQQVSTVGELLHPFVEQMQSARRFFPAVAVGTATEAYPAVEGNVLRLEPVSMARPDADEPQTVALSGQLPWLWQAEDESWHCLVITGSNRKSRHADKYVIGPLLTLMALSAGDCPCPWSGASRMNLHVAYRSRVLSRQYALDVQSSKTYLTDLLKAFFAPLPVLWLPFTTVFDHKDLRAWIIADEIDDGARAAFYLTLQEIMRTTADLRSQMAGAMLSPDILDRARQRFRVFV
ncbi:exodeoxyribonuclease V subunit gamma [uncultured Desulfosarcina sp.]|uniref:exodeoxyribonuclease V subunit gamma n=1 Tax=uncultured Desulfosarcina sp. TaxID=218289 RepID=UPI0029C7D1BE|nr:exodeoxyribonuclease V subunit gamma [uncultured Desulfosarcina sp.]